VYVCYRNDIPVIYFEYRLTLRATNITLHYIGTSVSIEYHPYTLISSIMPEINSSVFEDKKSPLMPFSTPFHKAKAIDVDDEDSTSIIRSSTSSENANMSRQVDNVTEDDDQIIPDRKSIILGVARESEIYRSSVIQAQHLQYTQSQPIGRLYRPGAPSRIDISPVKHSRASSFPESLSALMSMPNLARLSSRDSLQVAKRRPSPNDCSDTASENQQRPAKARTIPSQATKILELFSVTLDALMEDGRQSACSELAPLPLTISRNASLAFPPNNTTKETDYESSKARSVRKISLQLPELNNGRSKSFGSMKVMHSPKMQFKSPDIRAIGSPRSTSSAYNTSESKLVLILRTKYRVRTVELCLPAFLPPLSPAKLIPMTNTKGYDDYSLALDMRIHYRSLVGWWMYYVGPKTLVSSRVIGPLSQKADREYAWLKGEKNEKKGDWRQGSTFLNEDIYHDKRKRVEITTRKSNADKLTEIIKNPKKGKRRFAWIGWARKMALAVEKTDDNDNDGDDDPGMGLGIRQSIEAGRAFSHNNKSSFIPATSQMPGQKPASHDVFHDEKDEIEGLEFIVSWSVGRISIALVVMFVLSIAAALLWSLLVHTSQSRKRQVEGGFIVGIGAVVIQTFGFALWCFWGSRL